MFIIKSDGYKIYDSRLNKYPIFNTQIDLELNKTGSFVFEIYPTHPNFDKLHKMKSIITIEQDGELIFRGRPLNDEQGYYNQKQVTCEGELAFLLDSVMRPYGSESDPWNGTPREYLKMLLDNHNSQVDEWKQFKLGTVDVPVKASTGNITRSDSEYKTTWDLINEKLIDSLGGYLWVRHEENEIYLDYLEDLNILGNQSIKFRKNLLDFKKSVKGEEVMTVMIPLGAKPDGSESRITIADANNGVDYLIDEKAVTELGRIVKTVVFEDVEDADTLLKKAKKYFADAVKFSGSIELTAADMAGTTNVNPFRLGRKIEIIDSYHDLSDANVDGSNFFLIEKISINPLQPESNKLTVGATFKTFTESTNNAQGQIAATVEKIEKNVQGYATQAQLSSAVTQSSTEIMTQVSEKYYLKDETDALIQATETKFTQTNEDFEFRFNEFQLNTDEQFSEFSKYNRFEDGNIILGESGNEITLRIENDRISFLDAGAEVAYFSNKQLHILDGTFLNSLKIGKFAFIPRENGNLSLVKVGN